MSFLLFLCCTLLMVCNGEHPGRDRSPANHNQGPPHPQNNGDRNGKMPPSPGNAAQANPSRITIPPRESTPQRLVPLQGGGYGPAGARPNPQQNELGGRPNDGPNNPPQPKGGPNRDPNGRRNDGQPPNPKSNGQGQIPNNPQPPAQGSAAYPDPLPQRVSLGDIGGSEYPIRPVFPGPTRVSAGSSAMDAPPNPLPNSQPRTPNNPPQPQPQPQGKLGNPNPRPKGQPNDGQPPPDPKSNGQGQNPNHQRPPAQSNAAHPNPQQNALGGGRPNNGPNNPPSDGQPQPRPQPQGGPNPGRNGQPQSGNGGSQNNGHHNNGQPQNPNNRQPPAQGSAAKPNPTRIAYGSPSWGAPGGGSNPNPTRISIGSNPNPTRISIGPRAMDAPAISLPIEGANNINHFTFTIDLAPSTYSFVLGIVLAIVLTAALMTCAMYRCTPRFTSYAKEDLKDEFNDGASAAARVIVDH